MLVFCTSKSVRVVTHFDSSHIQEGLRGSVQDLDVACKLCKRLSFLLYMDHMIVDRTASILPDINRITEVDNMG